MTVAEEVARRSMKKDARLLSVDEFVRFASGFGRSELLEEMRAEWHRREASGDPHFPHRLRLAAWCYQLDTLAHAQRSGTLGLFVKGDASRQ